MGLALLTLALIKVINEAISMQQNISNDYVPGYVYLIIILVFLMGGFAFFKNFKNKS